MSLCCYLPESKPAATKPKRAGVGRAAQKLFTRLSCAGKRGVLFGQEQPILFGCADASAKRWTYASWIEAQRDAVDGLPPSGTPFPSDLRFASAGTGEKGKETVLEPALYGFEMAFVATDIRVVVASDALKPSHNSPWPFGNLFHSKVPESDEEHEELQKKLTAWHVGAIRRLHARGGIATFTWHAHNPVRDEGERYSFGPSDKMADDIVTLLGAETIKSTPGRAIDADDATITTARSDAALKRFTDALDRIAAFAERLVVEAGADAKEEEKEKIPIIFRPFHEMNHPTFWWGAPEPVLVRKGNDTEIANAGALKSRELKFRALYHFTVHYLTVTKKVDNILFAYSPSVTAPPPTTKGKTSDEKQRTHTEAELSGFEPPAYDIVGIDHYPTHFDGYYKNHTKGRHAFVTGVRVLRSFAGTRAHEPLAAVTECGVLNLRGLDAPFSQPNTASGTKRPVFRRISRYWRDQFFPDLRAALVEPESGKNVADLCYFMLWKNHRISPADSASATNLQAYERNTADIDAALEGFWTQGASASKAIEDIREKIQSIDDKGDPDGDIDAKKLSKVDEDRNEFYGPFLGHPSTAEFLRIVHNGLAVSKGNMRHILFLHDITRACTP